MSIQFTLLKKLMDNNSNKNSVIDGDDKDDNYDENHYHDDHQHDTSKNVIGHTK